MASLNVAARLVLILTPDMTLAGLVELTAGATVSVAAPVVKVHT